MFRVLPIIAVAALAASAYAQDSAPAAGSSPTPAKASAAAPAKDAAGAKDAAAASGNIAVVNGKPIKRSELDLVIRQIKQPDTPELRASLRQKLIELEVLMQEARRRKIPEREDVKFQADNAARTVIIQALLREEIEQHKPTDAQIQAEYDRERQVAGEKEYKAHHILVDSEAQAKEIIAKLDKGDKFEDLAKGTKDVGSAANGGELDWAPPAAYVKPFSDAMVKLEKGKYTAAPVQSQFGWHVIRLDDVRPMQAPPLDQVRSHIVEALQQQQAKEFVDSLMKKATIK
ncbi:putative parvulin-type peptidyl-prolyl cis-trans isomerase [Burkholderiales bacterium]|nr:putative parvulin-type peptidyl-prolyl cis-trans isomerase [Burkholderiales bacterium]